MWALLYAFGLAVGLSAVNPQQPQSLRGAMVFTGIWSFIIPLVSLFIGGMVASRAAGVTTAASGALHGLVTWGLVTLTGVVLFAAALTSALNATGMAAVMSVSTFGGNGSSAYSLQGYVPDVEDALRPLNQRLTSEGRPTVRADQVRTAEAEVVREAIRDGDINRERLVRSITLSADLARPDAELVADRTVAQFEDAKRAAETAALRAADAAGKAFWGVFGVLILALGAALFGGSMGYPRRTGRAAPYSPIATPPYPHRPGEVHP
jgi:hypothetical protein